MVKSNLNLSQFVHSLFITGHYWSSMGKKSSNLGRRTRNARLKTLRRNALIDPLIDSNSQSQCSSSPTHLLQNVVFFTFSLLLLYFFACFVFCDQCVISQRFFVNLQFTWATINGLTLRTVMYNSVFNDHRNIQHFLSMF